MAMRDELAALVEKHGGNVNHDAVQNFKVGALASRLAELEGTVFVLNGVRHRVVSVYATAVNGVPMTGIDIIRSAPRRVFDDKDTTFVGNPPIAHDGAELDRMTRAEKVAFITHLVDGMPEGRVV
jgi:hypothetical protein